jgi:D-glycerate 3-kinase
MYLEGIMLATFIKQHNLPEEFSLSVEKYYKPIAQQLFDRFIESRSPFFVGINGCQGSGKSTLTDYIGDYLTSQYQLNVVVMSLDDFYYSSEERQALASSVHPLLATRGVPGTHDMTELTQVLKQLKTGETGFTVRKFNKATDEPCPKNDWQVIEQAADIVIVEGWCWGVAPQTEEQLKAPINELEVKHDTSGEWRNYVNQQLKEEYVSLYKEMDFWLALQAPSFDCVYKWRLEQEEKLKARNVGLKNSKIMSSAEILNFTQYFQRLSVQACNTFKESADIICYLDRQRKITEVANKAAV